MPDESENKAGPTDEIAELRAQNKIIMNQLAQLTGNISDATRVREPEYVPPSAEEFQTNAPGAIQRMLDRELAPLKQFTFQMARTNQLQSIKTTLLKQYSDLALFEDLYDSLMANSNPVTGQTGLAAYYMAKGQYAEKVGLSGKTENIVNKENKELVPAHLKPSAPAGRNEGDKPKIRNLNELEERMRRENGMTAAEFLYYQGELTKAQWKAIEPDTPAK